MPRNCKCGGELIGLLGLWERCSDGKRVAAFKCNRCHIIRTQGLRKSTPKTTAAEA